MYMASCAASGPGASWARASPCLYSSVGDPRTRADQIALHGRGERDGPAESERAETNEVAGEVAGGHPNGAGGRRRSGEGHRGFLGASAAARARSARPRWLTASFSSGVASPKVCPSSSLKKSGS